MAVLRNARGPSRLSPLPSSSIVCAAGTDAYLWLGDDDGFLHTLDHDFQLRSLKSFDVCFVSMHAAVHASCIVCIGRDLQSEKPGKGPVGNGMDQLEDPRIRKGVLKYKCYSTTQVDGKGNPVLLREAGLFSKIPEQVVVCSDINKNFTMLAVGTESAGVCLFRGDLLREKTCRLRLMKENDEAVASVRFLASQSDSNTHYMLVCNTSSIACYAVTLKGEPKVCHTDSVSTASPHVVGALASLGTFVIHHGEGIFCVDPEQGNLWALPSEDRCHILTTHKSYIVSVTTEESSADAEPTHAGSAEILPEKFSPLQSKSSCSGRRARFFLPQHQMLTIHLCYPELRLIAYSSPMRGVRHVVSAMDTLFVIARGGATENNVLFDVKEKSFDERLCILLRYAVSLLGLVAVSMATSTSSPRTDLAPQLSVHPSVSVGFACSRKRLFNWAAEVTIKDHQPQQVLQARMRIY
ncbi:vacuolar membrane related protein [Cyclospora cayetanensis]|uniref:Vacuolar membrane related protein n=1 Tax=Cyclospora cayetanensis TaxID=88456 RepID=A0A1D3CZN7_9EIME|nr:vacuolar membrane related protein [Cyclospora cayetanensis]